MQSKSVRAFKSARSVCEDLRREKESEKELEREASSRGVDRVARLVRYFFPRSVAILPSKLQQDRRTSARET
jgi:hypothetical protein